MRFTPIAEIHLRNRRSLRRVLLLALLLSACSPLVPATKPAQLQHTPGPFFTITETQFDAGFFRLGYPATWRVVLLSPADAPLLRVVFVAPDQSTVSVSQVESSDAPTEETLLQLADGTALKVEIHATDNATASFADQAEKLIASIQT